MVPKVAAHSPAPQEGGIPDDELGFRPFGRTEAFGALAPLGDGVVVPLTQLVRRDLVVAADTIRQWSRSGAPEMGSLIDPQQAAVLSQMREVLSKMLEWEGYREVITMLRDIIRLQQELQRETQEALEDRADDVFDD